MDITNKSTIDSWSGFTNEDLVNFGDDGDTARSNLIDPAVFDLVGDIQGKTILDAGCGNGYLSRKLARRGATVTGIEPATTLFNYCLEKEAQEKLGIMYLQQDLSELRSNTQFDQVLLINVLMDIPDYKTALQRCIATLKPGGEIIISILHPAFPGFENDWSALGHVEISEYFKAEPVKQKYGYFFPRPLSTYINDLISMGCIIARVVEPQLPGAAVESRNKHVPQFLIIKATKN